MKAISKPQINISHQDTQFITTLAIHGKVGQLDLAGYKERVKTLRAAFPDQFFDIQGLFADGDAVVMTWLWSATHKGDIPGFPATGKQIKMSGATVYYFDGSRLTGHWQITDRLGVYQQLQRASTGA